jgi:DNA-binding CsgD family transcriptional regulator
MAASIPGHHLQSFIDEIYGEVAEADALDVLGPLFRAMGTRLPFSSGLFVRFDPSDWTVTVPYTQNVDPDPMPAHGGHCRRLDPHRLRLTDLTRPNEVVPMADIVDVDRVGRGDYGEPMNILDHCHAMAMVPFVRGVPLGAVAVRRPRLQPDFDPDERAVFRWMVSHAARAMDYRHLISRLRHPDPATMIVDVPERRILALSDEARAVLAGMPDDRVLVLPSESDRPGLLLSGGQPYTVCSADLGSRSLWRLPAAAQLNLNPDQDLTDRRVHVSPEDPRQRVMVLLERVDASAEAQGKLISLGLTPRLAQVALLLVLGKGLKEIARTCGISPNTAKEYVADVYQRLDVHTRGAFLAKMTGVTASN